eukprot:12986588-Alexandrium_andersonii.AAC.1
MPSWPLLARRGARRGLCNSGQRRLAAHPDAKKKVRKRRKLLEAARSRSKPLKCALSLLQA